MSFITAALRKKIEAVPEQAAEALLASLQFPQPIESRPQTLCAVLDAVDQVIRRLTLEGETISEETRAWAFSTMVCLETHVNNSAGSDVTLSSDQTETTPSLTEYSPDLVPELLRITANCDRSLRRPREACKFGFDILNTNSYDDAFANELPRLLSEDSRRVLTHNATGSGVTSPIQLRDTIDFRGLDNLAAFRIAHNLLQDTETIVLPTSFEPLVDGCPPHIAEDHNRMENFSQLLSKVSKSWQQAMADLKIIQEFLTKHQDKFSHHPAFQNLDTICAGISLVIDIANDSTVRFLEDGRTCIVTLPKKVAPLFSSDEREHEINTPNPFEAKAAVIKKLKLSNLVSYLSTVAVMVNYYAEARRLDENLNGCIPTISESKGFTLRVKRLQHPGLAIQEFKMPTTRVVGATLDENTYKPYLGPLIEKGLLATMEKRSGYGTPSLFWTRAASGAFQQVRDILEAINIPSENEMSPEKIRTFLYDSYKASRFFPYEEFIMDESNRIIILTGANARGKSAFMKSVAHVVSRATTGVHCPADAVEISICDRLFSNFFQLDNIHGLSTFRGQMRLVVNYFSLASSQSLGIFDELFHGTSSPYLLSLAWATLEEIERRELRAIISTHEGLLTLFTEADGLTKLRGRFALQSQEVEAHRQRLGAANFSIGENYTLQPRAVLDSDAFRIAAEEKLPNTILRRAKEIFTDLISLEG